MGRLVGGFDWCGGGSGGLDWEGGCDGEGKSDGESDKGGCILGEGGWTLCVEWEVGGGKEEVRRGMFAVSGAVRMGDAGARV